MSQLKEMRVSADPYEDAPEAVLSPETERELREREAQAIRGLQTAYRRLREEIAKVIIGQQDIVDQLLISLFSKGHCLLIGVPGLAKTLLVSTASQVLHLSYRRIQFTPDLMPSDITGTDVLQDDPETGRRSFQFMQGPLFTNILLADEINRTPPKTQAALLEAMQERHVTVGSSTYRLPQPFFVLATQNPIEQEGTYPLPEAQLDRFMFNIVVEYLPEDEEVAVVTQTTGAAIDDLQPIFEGSELIRFREAVRSVPIAEDVARYAVRLASASRPHEQNTPSFINDWVNWGAGLRAGQYLVLGAKARALLNGQSHVSIEDIRAMAHPTLRHRILVNYRAEADGISVESVIDKLVETVQPPA